MGGPQAGIIAGQAKWVSKLKKEPFFRAMRCDKLVLGVLQSTVEEYLEAKNPARQPKLPVIQLLAQPVKDLERRARVLLEQMKDLPCDIRMESATSQVGGGTMPSAEIPSISLSLRPHHLTPAELGEHLRQGHPPVVGYVAQKQFKLDLRTVYPEQDAELIQSLRQTFTGHHD